MPGLHDSALHRLDQRRGDVHDDVAGAEVADIVFEEATSFALGEIYHEIYFDAVLGLAQYNSSFERNFMSPLSAMMVQGVLDENLFSLRLSRSDDDEPGQLTLGGVNEDLYTGELIELPVTNKQDRWLFDSAKWQVSARSLSFGHGDQTIHRTFAKDHIAIFETHHPYIFVEAEVAEGINDLIGAEPIDWFPDSVPCSRRSELPDLTINLNGYNFTITAYDYTLEVDIEKYGLRCLSAFIGLIEPGEPVIVLGSAFLKAFVSVYHVDDRTVSCKSNSQFSSLSLSL